MRGKRRLRKEESGQRKSEEEEEEEGEERNGKERQQKEQERDRRATADTRREGRAGRGKKKKNRRRKRQTGPWGAKTRAPSLSPSADSELVMMPKPQSCQGELMNKYLWVGADICKHSGGIESQVLQGYRLVKITPQLRIKKKKKNNKNKTKQNTEQQSQCELEMESCAIAVGLRQMPGRKGPQGADFRMQAPLGPSISF